MFIRIVLALLFTVFATGVQAQTPFRPLPKKVEVEHPNKTALVTVLVEGEVNNINRVQNLRDFTKAAIKVVCPQKCTPGDAEELKKLLAKKDTVVGVRVGN